MDEEYDLDPEEMEEMYAEEEYDEDEEQYQPTEEGLPKYLKLRKKHFSLPKNLLNMRNALAWILMKIENICTLL